MGDGATQRDARLVELRIPGIGGPSPESVLGCPADTSFVQWRSELGARSTVRIVSATKVNDTTAEVPSPSPFSRSSVKSGTSVAVRMPPRISS